MDIERGQERPFEKSHDEFFGRLIVAILVLGVLFVIGFLSFLGYRIYGQHFEGTVSIADIPKTGTVADSEVVPSPDMGSEKEPEPETPPVDVKNLSISVLNGGGAKGSAGILAEELKKADFLKVVAGNAEGDYTGVTVFYQEGQETPAKTVLSDVVKKYPKAALSPVDPKRSETGGTPVVVILGK
ncbi:MAG: LytR C-terminal domain-containing protein [Candidatus Moranbacteria bacterium]|jgi:hypothetical protein|nr:LytR C-terminal domain-containing protein [Candidatus Moranbacteria bacterium]